MHRIQVSYGHKESYQKESHLSSVQTPETEASTSDTNGDLNSCKGNLDELHCDDPIISENSGSDSIITGHCQKGDLISKLSSSIFIHFHKLFLFNGLIYVV